MGLAVSLVPSRENTCVNAVPGVTLGVPKVSVDVVDVDENRGGVEFELGMEELEEAEERRS